MQRSSQRWWMEKLKTAIRIKLIKKKEKEKERWVNTIIGSSSAYKVQLEEGLHDWRFRNSWFLDQFTLIEDRRHDYKTRILHKFNSTGCKPGPKIFDQGHPSSPEKSNFKIIKEGSVFFMHLAISNELSIMFMSFLIWLAHAPKHIERSRSLVAENQMVSRARKEEGFHAALNNVSTVYVLPDGKKKERFNSA